MIIDGLSTALRAIYRTHLIKAFHPTALTTQFGCIHKRSTTQASLYYTLIQSHAKSTKATLISLYADVTDAFYAISRQQALGTTDIHTHTYNNYVTSSVSPKTSLKSFNTTYSTSPTYNPKPPSTTPTPHPHLSQPYKTPHAPPGTPTTAPTPPLS
eukprot:3347650-Alexandrium_andersonii.AAC.1